MSIDQTRPYYQCNVDIQSTRRKFNAYAAASSSYSLRFYTFEGGKVFQPQSDWKCYIGYGESEYATELHIVEGEVSDGTGDNPNYVQFELQPEDLLVGQYFCQLKITNGEDDESVDYLAYIFGNGWLHIQNSPITGGYTDLEMTQTLNWDSIVNEGTTPWSAATNAAANTAVWGSITGDVSDQTDLYDVFLTESNASSEYLTQSNAASTYLKLNASNDPVTGELDIIGKLEVNQQYPNWDQASLVVGKTTEASHILLTDNDEGVLKTKIDGDLAILELRMNATDGIVFKTGTSGLVDKDVFVVGVDHNVRLANLTNNGFIKTNDEDGTLSVDTTSYLTESNASSTYLTQSNAASTYETISNVAAHTTDATIHFVESSIDHENILNIGSNSHSQIDTHMGDTTVHFIESSIDHANIQNLDYENAGHTGFLSESNAASEYLTISNAASTTSNSAGCSLIGIPVIDTPTWTTQCHFNNLFGSTGRATGGEVTLTAGNVCSVASGTGFIKATDSDTVELLSFDWDAVTGLAIPTDTIRYIMVEYGSPPTAKLATLETDWDLDTSFPLAKIVNEGGVLHILNNPWWVTDGTTNIIERIEAEGIVVRDKHVGGLSLGVNASRQVSVTAGKLWSRLNEFPIAELTAGSSFESYWRSGATAWTDTDITVVPITQYNRLSDNTLQTISPQKYFVWWFYVEADDSEIAAVYPQQTFNTSAGAEATAPPSSIPIHLSENGILIGRAIFKQGTATPILVQSAFSTVFTASQAADHGNLAGLSDDDHTQYSLVSGSRAFTGTIGGITPVADTDLTTKLYVDNGLSNAASNVSSTYLKLDCSNDPLIGELVTNEDVKIQVDSKKLYFGAGDDASITYDGSDFVFTQEVGAGDFVFTGGNVGIGTTLPLSALDVTGDLRFGSETTGGALIISRGDAGETNYRDLTVVANDLIFKTATSDESASSADRLKIDFGATGDIHVVADSQKLYFGAGDDASITYDGTDLCINTADVGSGTVKINGVAAWSGTFTNGDGATVTVTDGLITGVV